MGKRFAFEVLKYIELSKKIFRISFIGHSMGGLIIRSALKYLREERNHFYAYISICTPHLGYLYSPSNLVKVGLWYLNTWQKCKSITELCMQDSQNIRETLLYKLAER
jgi:hypothetical protein